MILSTKYCFSTLAAFLLLCLPLMAQEDGRFSEKKIKDQELYIEANKYRLLGNHEKAAELLQELLKKDRQNHAAAYELARIYADQNRNADALNLAKQAAGIDPENQWYKKFLADIYQRNNLFAEAALLYEELVTASPSDENNYYKWAYFLVQAGQPVKALQVYESLEGRIGIHEELSRRKHALYLGSGDTQKAELELLRLCEAFPANTDYLHLLAGFYRQMENIPGAKAVYQKIIETDPNDTKAFFALSSIDSPAAGDAAFLQSLDPIFLNPQVDLDEKIKQILPLVEKAAATNDDILARELLRLASILDRIHPAQAKVCALNGDLLYLTGEKEKALERYRQAIELDDSVFSVWEQLFQLAVQTADYTSLVFYTEKAMDLFPNQVSVFFYNGLGYCRQENYAKGIPSLEQALLMTGKNAGLKAQVLTQLGLAQQYAGQHGQERTGFPASPDPEPRKRHGPGWIQLRVDVEGRNPGKGNGNDSQGQ
ncbi:MAG: tetratricopeptide repeat protein [Saprospirales bacterium]|nr:tetratricopeptide repeat protein [Saprospirales bacterium]